MQKAILFFSLFVASSGMDYAGDANQGIPAMPVENSGDNAKQNLEIMDTEITLTDRNSQEEGDTAGSNGDIVIRAKRYCGYGCCGGCMNCNCATMAPVTYAPCGCCGCGYG
ncbi:hypothetical protein RB195_014804 [Necator americanus]|uniref:Uncharacterized protein n=2 Tax=Necator americanus TaxID=51031 RepID=A0ABR1E242_NECAM|nr:hypothetical protein NECAME_10407 [Necator americanus]ETN78343.1 hypothetical protein NECAME_10407 [Necator americanus]